MYGGTRKESSYYLDSPRGRGLPADKEVELPQPSGPPGPHLAPIDNQGHFYIHPKPMRSSPTPVESFKSSPRTDTKLGSPDVLSNLEQHPLKNRPGSFHAIHTKTNNLTLPEASTSSNNINNLSMPNMPNDNTELLPTAPELSLPLAQHAKNPLVGNDTLGDIQGENLTERLPESHCVPSAINGNKSHVGEDEQPPVSRVAFVDPPPSPRRRPPRKSTRKSLYSPPEPDEHVLHKIHRQVAKVCRKIAESSQFTNFITLAIVVASVLVGLQTYDQMTGVKVLALMDQIVLIIFTAECIIKIVAYYLRPWRYFNDPWNKFDFIVVVVCYMPIDASMVTILRLARLLRVLKLVKALPELQVLVMGLLASLPSIFYVGLLLMLVFYLYAVLCITMFRNNDPVHFPDLQSTFLTLFRVATFEDWTDVMYSQMHGCDKYGLPYYQRKCNKPKAMGWLPAVIFVSFIFVASFTVLNLFIGVISSSMSDARAALSEKEGSNVIDDGEEDDRDHDQEHFETAMTRIDDIQGRLIKTSERFEELSDDVHNLLKQLRVAKQIRQQRSKTLQQKKALQREQSIKNFKFKIFGEPSTPKASG
mmetsp:Transcript_22288/g.26807  ORF Transcript_22288/g.26807 Transcript_22288/m.26807 type:complete len:590 (+) Transcript_22288:347-2116(+)|eukprot:CAMPEP_0197857526 /NCGR_PEP_ID=MMETSP1438-20131217/30686_1 /TAXON_ID=1461541 /ORGANISM="Pterosperma sp., Strain CCMP1384" /LENGTH=589 /DNA_ID=CAMNT_0043473391 /DNA_START=332 /DNA_END=2101 /DNA_ORIENTATION=+